MKKSAYYKLMMYKKANFMQLFWQKIRRYLLNLYIKGYSAVLEAIYPYTEDAKKQKVFENMINDIDIILNIKETAKDSMAMWGRQLLKYPADKSNFEKRQEWSRYRDKWKKIGLGAKPLAQRYWKYIIED